MGQETTRQTRVQVAEGSGRPAGWDVGSLSFAGALRAAPSRSPRVEASVAPAVRYKLDEAFRLAATAVREQPACSGLFARLGTHGEEALSGTVYGGGGEVGACLREAPAFTCVGCRRTTLCPVFSRLDAAASATVLIHEALHFAGLKERPAYPGAMSATEITDMVERSCRL